MCVEKSSFKIKGTVAMKGAEGVIRTNERIKHSEYV